MALNGTRPSGDLLRKSTGFPGEGNRPPLENAVLRFAEPQAGGSSGVRKAQSNKKARLSESAPNWSDGKMEVYLVRHGETDWNAQGRLQGREDIPLNEVGIAQAEACGEALQYLELNGIYSSPLSRARDTAIEISRYHDGRVYLAEAITERDYGKLTGFTAEQRQRWQAKGLPDKAEPWRDLARRAMNAMEYFAGQAGEQGRVVVVSHGAWINAVLAVVSKHEIGTGKTKLKNGGISVLRHQEETGWQIVCHNLSAQEYLAWAGGGDDLAAQ